MATHLADHAVAGFLTIGLHHIGYVADSVACLGGVDAFVERRQGRLQKAHRLWVDLAYCKRVTAVAVETVQVHHKVGAHYVAVAEYIVRGETVDNVLIHLYAQGPWKSMITEACGNASIVKNKFPRHIVDTAGGYAWLYPFSHLAQCACREITGGAHQFKFLCCLKVNHYDLSIKPLVKTNYGLECRISGCSAFDSAIFHQTVIVAHEQVSFHNAEGVKHNAYDDEQRCTAEELSEAAVQAKHVCYGGQYCHDAQEY